MNIICFISSFCFLMTSLLAFYKKYYLYGILLLLLCFTSLMVHSNKTNYLIIIDKICILLVVLYGGYLFYEKTKLYNRFSLRNLILQFFVFLSFVVVIYLYYYGYYTNQYCFDKNINKANLYHSFLHFISCYGHNIIIIL
jgi:hypothetical protein